jgi:hypothetical protein
MSDAFRGKLVEVLGLKDSPTIWLSVSFNGQVLSLGNKGEAADLANVCLGPEPTILSFNRIKPLSAIYETIINSSVFPKQSRLHGYEQAIRLLKKPDGSLTNHYMAYMKYENTYTELLNQVLQAKSPEAEQTWSERLRQTELNWAHFGYKEEIAGALNTIHADAFSNTSQAANQRRPQVLDHFRALSLSPSDTLNAFRSPLSEFLPTLSSWSDTQGWLKISYSELDPLIKTNTLSPSASNDAGFTRFTYELDVKRISIHRPWLDLELLTRPQSWTWRRTNKTYVFPLVAVDPSPDGTPVASSANSYDGHAIDCALLPFELIIARERSLLATMSRKAYEEALDTNGSFGTLLALSKAGGASTKIKT